MPGDSAGPGRDVESLDRQTTRPVAPDGDRRPHRVWHRRGTGADREADAEPAAPDSDTRGGEEDSGYHAQNQAAGRDAVDGANARQTPARVAHEDRKSTRLNSSHVRISYAVFCLKKKNK